jgi:uncharacterized protein YdhG (YjbR/CyaY superfamily)
MNSVEKYLSKLEPTSKEQLERIRQIVRAAVPEVDEVISYGLPGFKYKGKYLLGYGVFKSHLSLFPTSHPVEALQDEFKNFKISKGTIQFTLENPLPEELIKEIIQIRLRDIRSS